MKKYRIVAGEGEQGRVEAHAKTLRGARRLATIARCRGDRWARIEENLEGQKNNLDQDMTGWMEIK